jgi:hypothetical protein
MEHQGENEDHVLTTMENNPIRKTIFFFWRGCWYKLWQLMKL